MGIFNLLSMADIPSDMMDELAKAAAAEAIAQFDKNGDGRIDREEAEPMLKEAFEGMKAEGKVPASVSWNSEAFDEGFKHVDKDGSGYIETNEIEVFVKELFKRLASE